MISFRQAVVSDLECIVSWVKSAEECRLWAGAGLTYPIDLEKLPADIAFEISDSRILLFKGLIAAFGQVVPKPGGISHLARIIVAPTHRGKRLGRLLTRHLLDRALAQNPYIISLNVEKDNLIAIRLYESIGFRGVFIPAFDRLKNNFYMEYSFI